MQCSGKHLKPCRCLCTDLSIQVTSLKEKFWFPNSKGLGKKHLYSSQLDYPALFYLALEKRYLREFRDRQSIFSFKIHADKHPSHQHYPSDLYEIITLDSSVSSVWKKFHEPEIPRTTLRINFSLSLKEWKSQNAVIKHLFLMSFFFFMLTLLSLNRDDFQQQEHH